MKPFFRVLAAVVLASGTIWGQPGITGPPGCPGGAKIPVAPKRPNAEAELAAEKASATQKGVLVGEAPLHNLAIDRDRIADYFECVGNEGCYWSDMDATAQRAEKALAGLIATKRPGEKTAIVFDIDDTAISGYCEMRREDFGYIDAMFNAWVVTPAASTTIPGTLRLFKEARAAGVAVFFITGRPHTQFAATERNLRLAGFAGWKQLIARDQAELHTPAVEYKARARAKVAAQGYRLLMNIGDQWSDLNGEPRRELNVKLPNPLYFLP